MRSVFAVALCTGVAMVGLSVHGLLGIDAQLAKSAVAAQQQRIEYHSVRVLHRGGDCNRAPGTTKSSARI
jgi:hypothetical protein